jgi:hypothetical protein
LTRITAQLRPEVEAAERDATRAVRGVAPDAIGDLLGDLAAERWGRLTISQRRAVLDTLISAVTILPTRQGPGFDPASVAIEWRTQAAS